MTTTATGLTLTLNGQLFLADWKLLEEYHAASAELTAAQSKIGRLEQEIRRRADDRGATGIPSDIFDCTIKITNSYDQPRLVPLKEILSENDLADCYTPAHQETQDIPAKWNVTKTKAVGRRYGDRALRIIEQARIPSGRKLEFGVK